MKVQIEEKLTKHKAKCLMCKKVITKGDKSLTIRAFKLKVHYICLHCMENLGV